MPASNARLALIVAAANLTACALVGTVLLVTTASGGTPQSQPPPAGQPTTASSVPTAVPSSTTQSSSSSPTPSTLPDNFQPVAGPAGFHTAIPAGWTTSPVRDSPGATQATDPAKPTRFVRYGGASADGEILKSHVDYEKATSKRLAGFARSQLREMTLHGNEAITWDFEWTAPEGLRHVRSVYWRKSGIEYFCYASSLASEWQEMDSILTTMTDNAKP
ncbi:hypothetical protein SAMN05421504_103944 [Amycolatopsis xylanica]|uniref:Serine/threonine protein kinase n=1 Tax=Amycolatopsis xylanica TaxID=589385 RepID=A0A1H3ERT2_9PSEU|nr:hypothetical protein [Amycolatopsis xylanica]SDX81257.1 hypothetical protein SAMN05421504_103944 [Amycolatopsis xylanica]